MVWRAGCTTSNFTWKLPCSLTVGVNRSTGFPPAHTVTFTCLPGCGGARWPVTVIGPNSSTCAERFAVSLGRTPMLTAWLETVPHCAWTVTFRDGFALVE